MADDVAAWVRKRVAAGAVAFRLRVGTGQQMSTQGVIVLAEHASAWEASNGHDEADSESVDDEDAAAQAVQEALVSAGWPDEHPTARVHSYGLRDGKRKEGPSWQRTARSGEGERQARHDPTGLAVKALADGYASQGAAMVRMLDKVTGVVGALTETLQHREAMGRELASDLVEAMRGQVQAEAAAAEQIVEGLVQDLEEQQAREEESDPLAEQAVSALRGLAERFSGGDPIEAILNDPEALDRALHDPRVQAAVARKMAEQGGTQS